MVIDICSVSAVVSLPGLAVSPIMGDLNRIFPHVSNLEIQMLTSIPSVLIIPFILLSGRLSVARNKIALLRTGLAIFFLSGVACLFARTMTQLIAVSCILGIGAGTVPKAHIDALFNLRHKKALRFGAEGRTTQSVDINCRPA